MSRTKGNGLGVNTQEVWIGAAGTRSLRSEHIGKGWGARRKDRGGEEQQQIEGSQKGMDGKPSKCHKTCPEKDRRRLHVSVSP